MKGIQEKQWRRQPPSTPKPLKGGMGAMGDPPGGYGRGGSPCLPTVGVPKQVAGDGEGREEGKGEGKKYM